LDQIARSAGDLVQNKKKEGEAETSPAQAAFPRPNSPDF